MDVNDWFYLIIVETDTHNIMLKEQGIYKKQTYGGIIIIMKV